MDRVLDDKTNFIDTYDKDHIDKKFESMSNVQNAVIVILIVMVATLIIDAFHFDSSTYTEYSGKIKTLDQLQKTNADLLDQNEKNQQLILQLQQQILGNQTFSK